MQENADSPETAGTSPDATPQEKIDDLKQKIGLLNRKTKYNRLWIVMFILLIPIIIIVSQVPALGGGGVLEFDFMNLEIKHSTIGYIMAVLFSFGVTYTYRENKEFKAEIEKCQDEIESLKENPE